MSWTILICLRLGLLALVLLDRAVLFDQSSLNAEARQYPQLQCEIDPERYSYPNKLLH